MLGGAHARSIIAASPSHCQLLLILRILRSFLGVSISLSEATTAQFEHLAPRALANEYLCAGVL